MYAIKAVAKAAGLDPFERAVLAAYALKVDEGKTPRFSGQSLAAGLGIHERSVTRAVKRLKAKGALIQLPGKPRQPVEYEVVLDTGQWRTP